MLKYALRNPDVTIITYFLITEDESKQTITGFDLVFIVQFKK